MKMKRVTARLISAAMVLSMLGQNITVYADETHVHSDSCYEQQLTCEQAEHTHDENCEGQQLVCEQEAHTHGEDCPQDEEGNYTCEIPEHTHGDECYEQQVCEQEQHTHGDECYEQKLICEQGDAEQEETNPEETKQEESKKVETKETKETKVVSVDEKDDVTTDEVAAGKATLNGTTYDTLEEAVNAAVSGDTIYLGAGKYTLYNKGAQTKGKDLTFVGQGPDTEWGIGATVPDPDKFGTEYNGDYSFDGAGTITFKDMILQSGTVDYLGFIRADNTVVDNCTINGKTFYWGYTSATFTNTTFNAPSYDYALWTYSSPTMTFDGCTFNTKGKVINVYRDYAGAAYTINFKDCTVNNESSGSWKELFQGTKQVLNINDSVPSGQSYTINISGNNVIAGGKVLNVDKFTCSRLFGFGNSSSNNAGNTVVNIEGTTVWQSGKRAVDHEHDFATGTYSNNKADGNDNQYTEGYKDNAYTIKETEIPLGNGLKGKKIVKTCNYCGWSTEKQEAEKSSANLDADMLVNSETNKVVKVQRGKTFSLTGALKVDTILNQMTALETLFNSTGQTLTVDSFGFTAELTLQDGMKLPSDLTKDQITSNGFASTFVIDEVEVAGQKVTVSFQLSDAAKQAIDSYTKLKEYVTASVNANGGWISVTVPGVTVDSSVAVGTKLTATGTVTGNFTGTASSQYTTITFPYEWTSSQWAQGKDDAATDDTTIQATVQVVATPTPTPDPDPTPSPDPTPDEPEPAHTDDAPAPVTPVAQIEESGNVAPVAPVAPVETPVEITETGNVTEEAPVEIVESGNVGTHVIATGDNSDMMLYLVIAMAAAAVLVIWTSKRHAR